MKYIYSTILIIGLCIGFVLLQLYLQKSTIFSYASKDKIKAPVKGSKQNALPVKGSKQNALPVKGSKQNALPVKGSKQNALPIKGSQQNALSIKGSQQNALLVKGARENKLPIKGARENKLVLPVNLVKTSLDKAVQSAPDLAPQLSHIAELETQLANIPTGTDQFRQKVGEINAYYNNNIASIKYSDDYLKNQILAAKDFLQTFDYLNTGGW